MRVSRTDKGAPPLAPAKQLPSGGVEIEGRAMRAGRLEYVRDGKPWIEVRSPSENEKAIPSLRAAPVTDNHPIEMVNADNAKKYAVGTVLDARAEDEWAVVKMAIHDGSAIQSAKRAGFLSAGYTCELGDPDPELEKRYGKHDAVQLNIVINHLARVDAARAGNDARVRLDNDGNEIAIVEDPKNNLVPVRQETRYMAQLKIDGLTFKVDDDNVQAAVDKAIGEREQRITALAKRADEAETARAEAEKKRSEAQAKYDAEVEKANADAERMVKCDECDGKGECKNCDGKGEYPKKMDTAERRKASQDRQVEKRAHERAVLVTEARKHLGTNEKLDGKSDIEIKRAIIARLSPKTKLDGKDDAYVCARYDAALEALAGTPAVDDARVVPFPRQAPPETKSDDKPKDADEAKRRSDEAFKSMHYKAKK